MSKSNSSTVHTKRSFNFGIHKAQGIKNSKKTGYIIITRLQISNVQWNLSVTTTSLIKFNTCDLFINVF